MSFDAGRFPAHGDRDSSVVKHAILSSTYVVNRFWVNAKNGLGAVKNPFLL